MEKIRTLAILLMLFGLSILVRRPLFDKEFTASHEWLSAHTLLTVQLWNDVPSSVHHWNLLYTFPSPADKFVNDMWGAGVMDRYGNYYYASMPHLSFLAPYLVFKAFHWPPTLRSLEMFGLLLHFVTAGLLYFLVRLLTRNRSGTEVASLAAFCFFLFTPTALFYYQNAVVGTVVVIPFTIGVLICVTALAGVETRPVWRAIAWLILCFSVLGGCLTDWQAYFTAFATALVAAIYAYRMRATRKTTIAIVLVCSFGAIAAIAAISLQDSRVAGWEPFTHAIFGRLKLRSGLENRGLASFYYYKQLFRFYASYFPFLAFTAGLLLLVVKRRKGGLRGLFRGVEMVLAISVLAVTADHIILANHTAVHIFTTLNGVVPMAILTGVAITSFYATSVNRRRDTILLSSALALCVAVSVGEYEYAYRNRAHPFRTSAAAITAIAKPSDVLFASGNDFQMPADFIVPQMLYYLRRNVQVVGNRADACRYLTAHPFNRGILARLNGDYSVAGIDVLLKQTCALE